MAHSVPDNVAVVIETDAGRVLHTSDWKLDHTPVDGFRTDVGRLAEIGNRGVDLLLCDSTNAERPGFTGSERLVGEAFRQIIPQRQGRVLIASFASNVHRMQQAIDVAVQTGRKVAVVGRSMRKNLNIAGNLGYLDVPEGTMIQPKELDEPRAGRGAGPLHRQPGRAALGADADRLPRPSDGLGRARRHGDHLGAAGARQRAARPRHDQPAARGGRRGAARGERGGARLRPREPGGDPHALRPRPAASGDADPRRVPDAGRERADGAGGRRAGRLDRAGRERVGRRARAGGSGDRRPRRGRHHVRRRTRRR